MDRRAKIGVLAAVLASAGLAQALLAQSIPVPRRTGGLLVSDLVGDKIYLCRDLNGDGDALDAGEINVWLDNANAGGFLLVTGAVLSILPSYDGSVYFSDLDTGAVFKCRDLNDDGDVNDDGEISYFYQGFGSIPAGSPNGLALDSLGRLHLSKARLVTSDSASVVRLEDRNDNGDAFGAGEATVYMNLNALATDGRQPVPFDICFDFQTGYAVDQGPNPDVVYRFVDENGDGVISAVERSVFMTDQEFGVRTNQAFANDGAAFYTIGRSGGAANPQQLFKLVDGDGSRSINDASEVTQVWSKASTPPGFNMGTAAAIALGADKIAVLSFGSSDQDNVFLLRDSNGDGLFTGAGETTVFVSSLTFESLLSTGRAVAWLGVPCAADFNLDGFLDQEDLSGFINAFFQEPSDPLANFNRDHDELGNLLVNQEDLAGYITEYFAQNC